MQVQLLRHEFPTDHPYLPGWRQYFNQVHILDDWRNVRKDMLVITGSDVRSWHVRHWLNQRQPALYIGRGYVGNHLYKQRKFWRVSVNGWANTKLLPVPHSRWAEMNLPRHEWKSQSESNLMAVYFLMHSLWFRITATLWLVYCR